MFVFENAEPIIDAATMVSTQPSVMIQAENLDQAIDKLVEEEEDEDEDWGKDVLDNIINGSITILLPRQLD